MKTLDFEQMIGETVDSEMSISGVFRTEPNRVIFNAERHAHAAELGNACLVVDTSDESDDNFKRFLEARFLNHPALVQPFLVDWLEMDGRRCPCMGVDRPEMLLNDRLMEAPLTDDEVLELTRDILAAFVYLHSENLVYGALNLSSIWRVDGHWKLSDFSQLRVPGTRPVTETRRLLINREVSAPPEAYYGEVSLAWDAWSLGVLLSKIALPIRKPGSNFANSRRTQPLSPVLEKLIAGCSELQPQDRLPAAEMLQLIESEPHAEDPQPVRAAVEAEPNLQAPRSQRPVLTFPPPTVRPVTAHSIFSPPGPRSSGNWVRTAKIAGIAAGVFAVSLGITKTMTRDANSSPSAAAPIPATSTSTTANPEPPEQDRVATAPQTAPASVAQMEISALLGKWANATRKGDVAGQVSCYAPVVDTYFERHSVPAADLAGEKAKIISRNGPLRRFDVLGLKFDDVSQDWAVVSLEKRWIFGGPSPASGLAHEQLVLRVIDGEWKITSERNIAR